jgi:regulator of sigma D
MNKFKAGDILVSDLDTIIVIKRISRTCYYYLCIYHTRTEWFPYNESDLVEFIDRGHFSVYSKIFSI